MGQTLNVVPEVETSVSDHLQIVQLLTHVYQSYERMDANFLRQYDLTVPQATVMFCLVSGEQSFKQLGEHTNITKGTLTGVIDRLEDKEWVVRLPCQLDRRSVQVALTLMGRRVIEHVMPAHEGFVGDTLHRLSPRQRHLAITALNQLQRCFSGGY